MHLVASLFTLLFTSTSWAADPTAVMLDITLKVNDVLVSEPKITSVSGQTASVQFTQNPQTAVVVEVTPTVQEGNQVHMSFVLATRSRQAKEGAGEKTVLSKPQLVALLGQTAEITQAASGESAQTIALTVTPTLYN